MPSRRFARAFKDSAHRVNNGGRIEAGHPGEIGGHGLIGRADMQQDQARTRLGGRLFDREGHQPVQVAQIRGHKNHRGMCLAIADRILHRGTSQLESVALIPDAHSARAHLSE